MTYFNLSPQSIWRFSTHSGRWLSADLGNEAEVGFRTALLLPIAQSAIL
jgi:hypothetical protein